MINYITFSGLGLAESNLLKNKNKKKIKDI